uniref:GDYXXLXY domain-containing protein n=1 Tax=Bordetella pseudohinzii TaxID=1331258 RepID=UPI00194032D6
MQVGTTRQVGSELHAWRQFLGRTTLWLAVLLLGSGVICWVAANWPGMGISRRFALAQGLLAVSVLASLWLALRLRGTDRLRQQAAGAVLTLSGLLLGALLALLGQTYQTGADTWELFAWWALLLLPWALAAASQVLWLLWCLVVNAALGLWIGEHLLAWWNQVSDPAFAALVMALANLIMLGVWEMMVRLRHSRTRVGPRVLAFLALIALILPLLFGDVVFGRHGHVTALAWIAVTLGLGYFYYRGRRDLVILAMLAAGVICVSLRVAGDWLMELAPGAWAALPLAALLMAEAVWAARWLRRLGERGQPAEGARAATQAADAEPAGISAGLSVDPADDAAPVIGLAEDTGTGGSATAPWYVQGLLGLSAWLATILLLVFLFFSGMVTSDQGAVVFGLILCAAGVAVLRAAAGPFWRQCAIAMAFAGQLLVVFSFVGNDSIASACLFIVLLAAAVYALAPDALLRFLSGGLIAFGMTGLVWQALQPDMGRNDVLEMWLALDMLRATFLWLPVAVLGAWLAALAFCADRRLARARPHFLEPLAWAFVVAVQGMVWMAGGVGVDQLPSLWKLHRLPAFLNIAGALLPAAAALWLLWPRRRVLTRALVVITPLALLVLALFWLPSPGIAFALTWLLLGFGLNKPRLTGFGVLSLLAYLLLYYYQLDVPLLQKAAWLAGAAVLLFLLRVLVWLLPRLMRTDDGARPALSPPAPAMRRRAAVVLAGLALVLAVCNITIYQREQLLAHGQVAILELAPVDPRSLMQGDYMALRFAAGTAGPQPRPAAEQTPTPGPLLAFPPARRGGPPPPLPAPAGPPAPPPRGVRPPGRRGGGGAAPHP